MHLSPQTFRDIAASVTLTCFAVGLFSAHGAGALSTQMAVADARAAAQELAADRAELEGSLAEAERVADEAATLAHEEQVARAATALDRAISAAAATASIETSEPVAVGTPEHDAPDEVEIVVDGVAEASDTAHGQAPGGDEPDAEDAEASDAAAASVPDVPSPTSADLSAALAQQQRDAVAARVAAATEEAASALEGEFDSRAQALDVAQTLAEASAEIDQATQELESESSALAAATAAVELQASAAALASSLVTARSQLAEANARVSAVGRHVTSATAVSSALEATGDLSAVIDAAAAADRTRTTAVDQARGQLEEAADSVDAALVDLRTVHEEWVATENARRDRVNDARLEQHRTDVEAARAEHAAANRDAVAARAAGWSGQPVGVAGSNGRVASASLCEVDLPGRHLLQCDAARALEDADAAYHAQTGGHLVVTDTYRSYSLQAVTRARKPSTAAAPGTSNHGWGMAIDLDGPSSAWLRAHGADYGWVHPVWARPGGSKPESWHLEYVASDVGAFEPPAKPSLLAPVASAFDGG